MRSYGVKAAGPVRRILVCGALIAVAAIGFAPAAHAAPHSTNVAYVTDFGAGWNDPAFLGSSIFTNAITGAPPGGGVYTTASGTVTTFSNVTVATIDGAGLAALAGFDTVMLYQVCDFASHPVLISTLNTFLVNGLGKVVIYDGDGCAPSGRGANPDYSAFLFPFATSNPGPRGSVQPITFVEAEAPPATLTHTVVAGFGSSDATDAVGDSNTFTSNAGGWCAAINGNNANGVTGIQVAYARTALGGLTIYNGQDNWFTFGANSYDKLLFDNTLDQPFNPDTLPCGVPVTGIKVGPSNATNPVGTSHTVTATVSDSNGSPIAGVTVTFTVTSGPNAGKTGSAVTNASGQATFTYSDTGGAGTDTISATFTDATGGLHTSNAAQKTWVNDCGSAKLLVGDKTLAQSTTDDDTSGMAEAFQATATASGTATVVCLYLAPTNSATKLVGGIYADNGSNKPGALLAQGTNSGPLVNAAWNTVQVPSVGLAAGTKYWITVLSPLGSGTLRFLDHCCTFQSYSPSSPSENSKELNLTTLPAAWTTGKRWPRDGHILGWSGG